MSYQHLWDTVVDYYNRSIAFDAPRPNDTPETQERKRAAQDANYALVWLIEQVRHSPLFSDFVPSQTLGALTLTPSAGNMAIYVRAPLPHFHIKAEYTADETPISTQEVSSDEVISALEQLVQWATGS